MTSTKNDAKTEGGVEDVAAYVERMLRANEANSKEIVGLLRRLEDQMGKIQADVARAFPGRGSRARG